MESVAFKSLRDLRCFGLRERIDQVAKRAGMSPATISNVERGARPLPTNLHKIAKGYKLTIEQVQTMLGVPV